MFFLKLLNKTRQDWQIYWPGYNGGAGENVGSEVSEHGHLSISWIYMTREKEKGFGDKFRIGGLMAVWVHAEQTESQWELGLRKILRREGVKKRHNSQIISETMWIHLWGIFS